MGKYPDIDVAEGVGIADAGRIEAGLKIVVVRFLVPRI
jgi:hypothetical protein